MEHGGRSAHSSDDGGGRDAVSSLKVTGDEAEDGGACKCGAFARASCEPCSKRFVK